MGKAQGSDPYFLFFLIKTFSHVKHEIFQRVGLRTTGDSHCPK